MSGYFVLCLNILTKYSHKLQLPSVKKSIGFIYENYKIDLKSQKYFTHLYNLIFLGRRLIYAIILIFLRDDPILQQVLNVVLQFAICIINVSQRPFKDKLTHFINSVIDTTTAVCFTFVAVFLSDKLSPKSRSNLGVVVILLVVLVTIVGWICFIAYIVIRIRIFLKGRKRYLSIHQAK